MTIQYCSDLHLEFPENKAYLQQNPILTDSEVLILAGDIFPFRELKKHQEFIDSVSRNYQYVYWLPGNHEYYHFDAAQKTGTLNESIRKNVLLVNNTIHHHGKVRLIFSTLWSKISLSNYHQIQRSISDFQLISWQGGSFTPHHFNRLHLQSRQFVENTLEKPHQGSTIVISHHVPTFFNYPEMYKGSSLNEAFAVELHDLIAGSQPDYWLFGHHHSNIPDFKIGNTLLSCNQLGYVRYGEHHGYQQEKVIRLSA